MSGNIWIIRPKNYKKTKQSPTSAQKKDPFDQIRTAVAKAVFNGERFVLNAKNVLSDLLLEDVDTLKDGKLSFEEFRGAMKDNETFKKFILKMAKA